MNKSVKSTLDTYNRVKTLESKVARLAIAIAFSLLLVMIFLSILSIIINHDTWEYGLIVSLISFIAAKSLYAFNKRSTKKCRFCGNLLAYILRPLLLNNKYLSMQGIKEGDYFYTQCRWGATPFKKRWAKICNRSLACHHCRLTEEKQNEFFQAPSDVEINHAKTKIDSK